jgi:hypothetical protein
MGAKIIDAHRGREYIKKKDQSLELKIRRKIKKSKIERR